MRRGWRRSSVEEREELILGEGGKGANWRRGWRRISLGERLEEEFIGGEVEGGVAWSWMEVVKEEG